MKKLGVRPDAELDAFEAALWYEGERAGLGSEFLESLREVFSRVEGMPLRFPLVAPDIRRAMLDRFPFGVFFTVDVEQPTVIAVMHLHRHPSVWEGRR